jgi:hypothetical protein
MPAETHDSPVAQLMMASPPSPPLPGAAPSLRGLGYGADLTVIVFVSPVAGTVTVISFRLPGLESPKPQSSRPLRERGQ